MAYENAKQVLKEALDKKAIYDRLCFRVLRLEAEITASGIKYDGLPRSTKPSNPTEAAAILLTETKEKRTKAWQDWRDAEYTVNGILNRITDTAQREVLAYKYLEGLQWDEIAVTLGYSERHTHRIHARALSEVQLILGGLE